MFFQLFKGSKTRKVPFNIPENPWNYAQNKEWPRLKDAGHFGEVLVVIGPN